MLSPRWPRPLPPGGTIGICSPAGPSPEESLVRAKAALEARGYRVVLAPNAGGVHPNRSYLAGTIDARVADLNGLLADPSVDLVLCARGGYGSAQLLDRIDYDALRADPKAVVGYSDITALSLAILAQAAVVSFSGIMATAGAGFGQDSLDPFSARSFFQVVGDSPFPRRLTPPDDAPSWTIHRGGGTVTGPVIPVCLSLLQSLLGTPYAPDSDGAILVLEDVSEELYAVDRALTQLRLAGILERVRAVLVGEFNGMGEHDAVLRDQVPRLVCEGTPDTVAVASGVAYGHIPRRWTLPVGALGTVDLNAGVWTFSSSMAEP